MNRDHAGTMWASSRYSSMLPTITGHLVGVQNQEVGSIESM